MVKKIMNFFKDEDGATAVEYGIMVAAIAALIIGVVVSIGNNVNVAFTKVDDNLSTMPAISGS